MTPRPSHPLDETATGLLIRKKPVMSELEDQTQGPSKRSRTNVTVAFHQDSKYRHYTPNFAALARQYPDTFGALVMYLDDEKTEAVINWEDPAAARALTQILLKHDFGLDWDIPLDRLCPPVPNRLNYICWIKDLLILDHPRLDDAGIRGLDVGTGASAIYPLLGAKVYGWSFLATDIDSVALQAAQANVIRNNLQHRLIFKQVPRADFSGISLQDENPALGPIRAALGGEHLDTLDFCMCNPPFFESLEEVGEKESVPHGCIDEMITPGGELAFVTAMLKDSLQLREKVRWYTSMVGKKVTLRRILALLREGHVVNVRTTEFLQGRTTRWGIAWSFTTDGLAELQGGRAVAHKVFGRKKMEKKREATETFIVKPNTPEEVVDEAAVIQRVVDFFNETQQVQVAGVGVGTGGAEDLYRRVVVAELSTVATTTTTGGPKTRKKIPETVLPMDPDWKKRCVVLVTVLAGSAAAAEHSDDDQSKGQPPQEHEESSREGEGEGWVKVTIEMTSGGDRAAFFKMVGVMPGEVGRTNRRWRRKLAGAGDGGGGGAGAKMAE